MAGLMVYLPGCTGQDPQELERRGLGDLLDRSVSPIMMPILSGGPDGGSGKLVTFDGPGLSDTPRNVDTATQEWRAAPPDPEHELEAGRYWLGYVKNAKPTPEELQRKQLIDGEPVVLADGCSWVIPIADFAPERLTYDPNTGAEISVPEDRHRLFVDRANEIFAHFMSDSFHELLSKELTATIPGGLSFAGLALSKNYRVNANAVDLLQLVGQVEAFEIARVAIGMKMVERLLAQKKSTALSSP
jgi:hypothetical protein